MIDKILQDSIKYPRLFYWWGKLPSEEIEAWEHEQSLSLPHDLKLLWNTMGGGDLFESETILQPFNTEEYDLVLPVSEIQWEKGLPKDHYVFHVGAWISAFRQADSTLVSMGLDDFQHMTEYRDLDSWYLATMRAEFAERYGM